MEGGRFDMEILCSVGMDEDLDLELVLELYTTVTFSLSIALLGTRNFVRTIDQLSLLFLTLVID